MGMLKKTLKGVTTKDVESASKGGAFGVDEGGYVCLIKDASLTEIKNGSNAGTPQIQLEVQPTVNWLDEEVDGPTIRSWVALTPEWASGSKNFTLLQFLRAIDGWDDDAEEPTFDFADEGELFDLLVGVELKARIGYHTSTPTPDYPQARVFNEVSRWLAPDAELKGGRKTFEEARAEVDNARPASTGEPTTRRKWTIGQKKED